MNDFAATARTATASRARPQARRDLPLLGATGFLLGLGLVVVYSASSVFAVKNYGDAEHFLTLQFMHVVAGVVTMVVMSRVRPEVLARRAAPLFVIALVLCALVLIPGLGRLVGGARRWLALGPFSFQPSEVAKLAMVVAMAALLARRDRKQEQARPSLLGPVLLVQVLVGLVLLGPDLGTALVLELVAAALVFAAGLRGRTLVLLGLAAMPVLYHLVVGTPFRLQRLLSYIDPWAYRSTVGYQITESLISIGSGGVLGEGLGAGKHKLFFLPEAHTDFIFAILAEELGLVGVVLLLAAFTVIVWRGVELALKARTAFDAYLAVGVTALIGVPVVFNLSVATGLLPTKGLPLPLISYGGSNLIMTLAAIGILWRLERDAGEGRS